MYIILVLGNNYIRGDKMRNRRIKSFFVPVIYGTLVLAFLFSMFFVGKFANNLLFSKKDNNIKYVDGEITEGANRDIPVVSTNNTIVKLNLSMIIRILLIIRKKLLYSMRILICKIQELIMLVRMFLMLLVF